MTIITLLLLLLLFISPIFTVAASMLKLAAMKQAVSWPQVMGAVSQAKGSKAWAREFSLQFKPGTAVALYYDPKRPKRATLTPKQLTSNSSGLQITSGIMILLSVGSHLLGTRGLITNYLNLSGSSVIITMAISTIATLLLGAALALLIQETH